MLTLADQVAIMSVLRISVFATGARYAVFLPRYNQVLAKAITTAGSFVAKIGDLRRELMRLRHVAKMRQGQLPFCFLFWIGQRRTRSHELLD